jgi:phage terminase large subunit GpA-like protein
VSTATSQEKLSKGLAATVLKYTVNPVELFAKGWTKFRPQAALTISDWADTYRVIGFGTSAEPGQWRTDRVPYMREPLDRLMNENVEEIIFCSSAQVGKSESILGIIGYFIHHDPSPQLFVLPDEPTCTELSRDRFEPMIQATPVLKELVSDYKGRGSENTKFVKRFPGGRLNFVGAQSPSQLSSKPIRVVLIDEVDRCNANCEGDIYSLARTRTTTFKNRKLFITSTPTLKDASPIWALYESTEQHKYHVACPGCKVSQVLVWGQVKWEGKGDERKTWYECPHCQHHWTEAERLRAVQKGEWKPTAQSQPGSELRRGYHLWAAYSPFVSLNEIVTNFLKCGKDKLKLQVFVNTVLGECWEDPDAQKLDWMELWERTENYEPLTVPKGGLLLTAGVDVQKDRLAIVVRAWGLGEESWLVYATELFGDIEKDDVWGQLSDLLQSKFTHAEKPVDLPIDCTFIDSSAFTQTVYNRVRTLSSKVNIKPSKGSSVETTPIIVRPSAQDVTVSGKVIKGGIKLWPVGVFGAKRQFMARLRFTEGPGTYHWYQVGQDYFQQICSESLQTRYVKGFAKQEWVLQQGVRNEFLDCEIYALAALYSLGCSHKGFWQRYEKRLAEAAPKEEEPIAPSKRRAVRREAKKGWMGK